jgi:hypothetical protein
MSRTFKHRPYWVRSNDPKNEHRVAWHDHDHLGEPIYNYRLIRDENDKTIEVEKTYVSSYDGYVKTYTTALTEKIVVGYISEVCTIDIPLQDDKTRYIPCHYQIAWWSVAQKSYKAGRMFAHDSENAQLMQTLGSLKKAFNSGEDLEEWEEYEELKKTGKTYRNWYDQ